MALTLSGTALAVGGMVLNFQAKNRRLAPNGTYFRRHLSLARRLRQRMTSWKGVNLAWQRE